MMTRRSFVLAALGAVPVLGADNWNKKPEEWSDKDIQKLLTNSPWAKDATVNFDMQGMGGGPPGGMGGPPGGGMGGPPGGGMGGPPGGGMGGPPGRGMDGPPGMPEIHALVRWESALPIRAALKEASESKSNQYVIRVTGLRTMPRRDSGGQGPNPADMQARMKEATRLERKGKDPIPASSAARDETGNSLSLLFTFEAESDPIQLKDKEVVFVTRMGLLQMKAKFVLKDMVYQGKLEL
jgi:hypothetical protein